MLHRSFKSVKCKTALKLAVSRIKLLKNKREAHVKQLKRELAQLLESGQDQTARIRVEHVVREEKTKAAYDLVEIYCELIAARLPMIESQKTCPIDLKEAVASVVFASPRCSDIPELMDVRKQMTAKYGKEFITAAVELRPDCGVNRLLVEKLSAKAPDGPTKMKILTAIAEEHNVKWEPKSFGESDMKSSQDSLVGPNTYEKSPYVEPPQVHVLPVGDDKCPPNLHTSSQYEEMQDISANLDENTSFAVKKVGGNKSTTSGRFKPEIRSSGTGNQEMDSTYSENRRDVPMSRQNWNMEFKDAASAARAAAESAERASMAARAAAQFSNNEKISRQYSSGSKSSTGRGLRDEVPKEIASHDDKHLSPEEAGMAAGAAAEQSNQETSTARQYSSGSQSSYRSNEVPQEYPSSNDEKHISTGSIDSTFRSSSSGMHNEQNNTREQDRSVKAYDEYYRNSASLKSSTSFGDDNPFAMDSKIANIYSQNSSFEQDNSDYSHEVSMKNGASRTTEADFLSQLHGDMSTENYYHFGDGRMNRQSSKASSTHFITPSDDHNDVIKLNSPMMGDNAAGDHFVSDEVNTQRKFMETKSNNDSVVIFDDSASEDDEYNFAFDKTYGEQESGSFISTPGRKSQIDPLTDKNAWSTGQVAEEKEGGFSSRSHFTEVSQTLRKSAVSSGKEDFLPVTFDDSDDPSSESEEDLIKSKVSGSQGHKNNVPDRSVNHGTLGSSSMYDENADSDRKYELSSSLAGSDALEEHFKRKIDITNVPEKDFGHDDLPTSMPFSKGRSPVLGSNLKASNHTLQSPDTFNKTGILEESYIESDKELNYGTLRGGLRDKSYTQSPYLKSSAVIVSSSLEDTLVQNEQTLPTASTSENSDAPGYDTYESKVSSRGDRSLSHGQDTQESRVNSRGYRSMNLREYNSSSDSNMYDLVLNSQKTMNSTQDPPRSQKEEDSKASKKSRSRVSITYFDSDDSYSEDEVPKQNLASLARPVSGFSRRTTASSKSGPDLSSKDAPVTSGAGLGWKSSRVSYESENHQIASSTMKTSDNLATSKHGSAEPAASRPIPEANMSPHEVTKSFAMVQPSSPFTKRPSVNNNIEASTSSNTKGDTPSERASHVHPKLPDYDSFAAHFLSLKKGRQ